MTNINKRFFLETLTFAAIKRIIESGIKKISRLFLKSANIVFIYVILLDNIPGIRFTKGSNSVEAYPLSCNLTSSKVLKNTKGII
jgi:hypothetical protein